MSQLSGNKRRLSKGKPTFKPFKKFKAQSASNDELRKKAKHPFQKPKPAATPLIKTPNDGSSKDGGDKGANGPLSKKDARERKRDRKSKRTNGQLRIDLNFMSSAVQNQVKLSKVSKKEQQVFVEKLLSKIKGSIQDIVCKLDATRNIQTAIKYGSQAQIMSVAEELKGHFVELCQGKYAHRTVRALLEYGRKAVRELVIPELMPALNKLVLHRLGSSVVDYAIMVVADEATKRKAFECFVAPKLSVSSALSSALSDGGDDGKQKETVQEILGASGSAQRDEILRNMHKFLMSGFEKEIMSTGIFQTVLSHYVHHMWHAPKRMEEIVEMVIEHIMQVQNVREGVTALVDVIDYSMQLKPKLRKAMLKNVAPFITNMCLDKHSYLVVMRLLDIYDDTKLLNRIIVQRLGEHLHLLLYHDFGRLVLLHLLCPRNEKYFGKNKQYQALMAAPLTTGAAQTVVKDWKKDKEAKSGKGSIFVDPSQQANCKKLFAVKHAELLEKLVPMLVEHCCANIKKILCHDLAGTVVIELLRVLLSLKEEDTMAAHAERLMRCIVDASLVDSTPREVSPTPPEPQPPVKPNAVELTNVVGDSLKMVHQKQATTPSTQAEAEPAPGTSLNNIDVSTMDASTAKNIVKLQQFAAMKKSDAEFMQLNAKYEVEFVHYQLLERRHRPQIKNEDEKHGIMEHGLGHRRLRKMVEEFTAIHPYFMQVLQDENVVTPQQWMHFLSVKGVYVVWELWNCGSDETKSALQNTLVPLWKDIGDEMTQKLKANELKKLCNAANAQKLNFDGLKKLCNALDIVCCL